MKLMVDNDIGLVDELERVVTREWVIVKRDFEVMVVKSKEASDIVVILGRGEVVEVTGLAIVMNVRKFGEDETGDSCHCP